MKSPPELHVFTTCIYGSVGSIRSSFYYYIPNSFHDMYWIFYFFVRWYMTQEQNWTENLTNIFVITLAARLAVSSIGSTFPVFFICMSTFFINGFGDGNCVKPTKHRFPITVTEAASDIDESHYVTESILIKHISQPARFM